MMSFSSIIRDILLQETHICLNEIFGTDTRHIMAMPIGNNDQNDVYFRFGGATLASMLHNQYKEIRSCSAVKRELISIEITILHTINNKDKSTIPAYLQYRDKGFMYFPDIAFIPFFRAVDDCVKKVVNEKGLKENGDELIKV